MPLTVITLKNSTPSLRGDLSKWMQEIATGVYIGNFSSRIREYLWSRVIESVGNGEATLSYASRNEIGYKFETYNTKRETIDCEGIPLVIFLAENRSSIQNIKTGFSNVAKYRKQRKFGIKVEKDISDRKQFIVMDIETTGLDYNIDEIIEIGALKISKEKIEEFSILVSCSKRLPSFIVKLTGITETILYEKGIELNRALELMVDFIGEETIVGYNISFDMKFINYNLKKLNKNPLQNRCVDILNIVKKENMYLNSYKLEDVLSEYGIEKSLEHRALSDAKQIARLINKLNDFDWYLNR